MRWSVYAVAILIAASLDASVGSLFAVGELRGQFLPAVVVFALLAAPRKLGVRIATLGGLVADLLSPVVLPTQEVLIVPGPRAPPIAPRALPYIHLHILIYHHKTHDTSQTHFLNKLLA